MHSEECLERVRGSYDGDPSQERTEADWSSAMDCVRKQREVGDNWA